MYIKELINNTLLNGVYNVKINMEDVLNYVIDMKRKEIKKQYSSQIKQFHKGTYKDYYYIYLRDQENKRRLLRKKREEDLIDAIREFIDEVNTKHTIEECFYGWLAEKTSIQKSTRDVYERVYKRFFKEIKDENIASFTQTKVKDFLKDAVGDGKITHKAYASLKTDLLGIFLFARENGYTNVSIKEVIEDMSTHFRGKFKPSKKSKKKDEELVFFDDEIEVITQFCMESNALVDLGILLMFGSGLRVGELSALKKADIENNYKILNVNKTEQRISSGAEYKIADNPKTEAGIRRVCLTEKYSKLLQKIVELSDDNSEFLFADEECERYSSKKFRDRLSCICNKLQMPHRSPHAIRRTYASILAENGISEPIIIKQMGHVNFSITKAFYIRNRRTTEDIIKELEKAI